MWDIFRSEAFEKLQELEDSLLSIESNGSNTSDIDAMYRSIHTVKGNARIMGLANMESLAHQAEDLMGLVRDEGVAFSSNIAKILFQVLDTFRTLIHEVAEQQQDIELEKVADLFEELQQLVQLSKDALKSLNNDDSGEISERTEESPPIAESLSEKPVENPVEEALDLSQDDMYRSIYLEMIQQDRHELTQGLLELQQGIEDSHPLVENILLSWYHATDNIGFHEVLSYLDNAQNNFNNSDYEEVLEHLEHFFHALFKEVSPNQEQQEVSQEIELNDEQLFFKHLETEISIFSEGLHQLLKEENTDLTLLQEALSAITGLAEQNNYVRLLNICHTLKQLLVPPVNHDFLKRAEYLFFKELVAIKESTIISGQKESEALSTIHYTFQQWHASQIFSHLAQLKALAEQLQLKDTMTTEVQIIIADIIQLLSYIHHSCLYYQLETASRLTTTLQDLYIRLSQQELPLSQVLPEETMFFLTGLGRAIDNPEELEEDFFSQLLSRVQTLNYEEEDESTLNYWISALNLDSGFKEVFTAENLITLENCHSKKMNFYLTQINLDQDAVFTEKVYQWLQDELIIPITNITVYKENHSEFKFLLSSMLNLHEIQNSVAAFDSTQTIQFEKVEINQTDKSTSQTQAQQSTINTPDDTRTRTSSPVLSKDKNNLNPKLQSLNPIQSHFLKVDINKVNRLMDLAGEIGLATGGLLSHPELRDLNLTGFQIVAQNLMTLIRELQGETSSLRLVPVSVIFKRMQRLIRDLKQSTQKEVELIVTGETTEIDKMMVDKLYDPLVHMIRNAVDHGIEDANERQRQGKSKVGKLVLNATHQAGEVVISLTDDGRGLNTESIVNKALENGLIETDQELEEQDIFELIFEPGFSTAQNLSTLSGRGVGMDVVKHTITELRGRYRIKSEKNKGTQIALHLPLTLAFIEGMIIEVNHSLYAIPIEAISEVFKVKRSQVTTISSERAEVIKVRDELIPTCWLQKFYNLGSFQDYQISDDKVVVVTQSSRGHLAIPVDRLIGNQQVTLKPLTGILKDIRAGAGYGLLSSGNVAIVLDCERLHAS